MATIPGVPDFITHEQYVEFFEAFGLDPKNAVEVRAATDGVHALVFATFPDGSRRVDPRGDGGYYKHRIFIPVRREEGDRRMTRVREVSGGRPVTSKEQDL